MRVWRFSQSLHGLVDKRLHVFREPLFMRSLRSRAGDALYSLKWINHRSHHRLLLLFQDTVLLISERQKHLTIGKSYTVIGQGNRNLGRITSLTIQVAFKPLTLSKSGWRWLVLLRHAIGEDAWNGWMRWRKISLIMMKQSYLLISWWCWFNVPNHSSSHSNVIRLNSQTNNCTSFTIESFSSTRASSTLW